MRFIELKEGDRFDFLHGGPLSTKGPWVKTGDRTYTNDSNPRLTERQIITVKAEVIAPKPAND